MDCNKNTHTLLPYVDLVVYEKMWLYNKKRGPAMAVTFPLGIPLQHNINTCLTTFLKLFSLFMHSCVCVSACVLIHLRGFVYVHIYSAKKIQWNLPTHSHKSAQKHFSRQQFMRTFNFLFCCWGSKQQQQGHTHTPT